jgi:ketosteroid isomerase-like protein
MPSAAPRTQSQSQSQSEDVARIRQLLDDRAAAMHARDATRFVSHYAPEIVNFDLAPPLQYTGEQVTDPQGVREWLSGFEGPIGLETHQLDVTVSGDVAFCHSLNRLSATPRGATRGPDGELHEGEPFYLWLRSTIGLRKIDGEWRITHEHSSTPFYMDGSFKAAVDLQP